MAQNEPEYWIFSSKPEGKYDNNVWDLATILQAKRYCLRKRQGNRGKVRPGDIVYMRTYGKAFIGKFVIGSEWTPLLDEQQEWKPEIAGVFPMEQVELWSRPLPQNLVLEDLSNRDFRGRIARITRDDGVMIETAQRVYSRLGFGDPGENIVILEKGLEEAIKPNLSKMGLKLADERIRQQFSMGPGVGRSDLICEDQEGALVVLELKRGTSSDEAVGQVLRYVGWLRENIAAEGQEVHGWIIAGDYDESLRLAALAADVRLVLVRLG